ncbi:ComEA family DNA-binding protein [Phocoenobacter skyensis]|uniref:Competence protein ComEA n=1 Tax=Phocoenobacter skyensis TaxID=97481 RepID=A0A1H7UFX5_9PAST|nr:helix-hairpin-helix domain-containing protein [Pasteurella skyensis]MDP8080034.1 helix-hairpin-helix domain-containing protein [Pasteurella skyensis]MDP8086024.1 helix-hairpin-helix domain-containing protein [Pasteurella skyensis]MDP8169861.1 helix-hairpin-helix domain-containing protein [Pasteurella skyensis]MDP8174035.1 helix-hairpin-helix domain-containing protein [Pasteurella skyensis]MDP8184572.1 helix-hairpin-helix domain-containing protein [Pasteurella skyensis]
MTFLKNCGLGVLLGLFATAVMAKDIPTKTSQSTKTNTTLTTQKVKVKSHINTVNINTATASELKDKLVGIGVKKAQTIVEHRQKHGKFLTVDQITDVSGIGKVTLEKNRERILIN